MTSSEFSFLRKLQGFFEAPDNYKKVNKINSNRTTTEQAITQNRFKCKIKTTTSEKS